MKSLFIEIILIRYFLFLLLNIINLIIIKHFFYIILYIRANVTIKD